MVFGWFSRAGRAALQSTDMLAEPRKPIGARQAAYKVGLVGESNYQSVIRDLREGELVALVPEPENPHDPRAIAVRDVEDRTIGYIPREHWLTAAMLDEQRPVSARVSSITGGGRGRMLGVVLTVSLGRKS